MAVDHFSRGHHLDERHAQHRFECKFLFERPSDPRLAEARLTLGAYKMFFDWDLEGAEAEYRRAMELDADYAVPHELIAYALRARGRHEEAIAEAKRATELDPLNLLMLGDLGVCYRFSGQVEQAIEINNRLIEMDPSFGDVRFENALAHSQIEIIRLRSRSL